ncbi:MAG: hypothetical protein JRI23_25945 [Deltaproteobacteria bacterium]|jgi:uncharacterized protein YgiM (DUF1202 family)|nr:hypothetical protein [Deltaproteobacteria bacterium]MBW2535471.1 hypothetical protein [Deltaproteobacteria bacterium]
MGLVWVGLGVAGVLALCLAFVFGLARLEDRARRGSLAKRAQSELETKSKAELLAEIDQKVEALEAEVQKVRTSAGAYSTVGNAAGAVTSLFVEIKQLEEYRAVVDQQ